MRSNRLFSAVLVGAIVAISGCGVPTQPKAEKVARAELDAAGIVPANDVNRGTIFLVQDESRVVAVERRLPPVPRKNLLQRKGESKTAFAQRSLVARHQRVLDALLKSPTAAERGAGRRSYLAEVAPANDAVTLVREEKGIAIVDLPTRLAGALLGNGSLSGPSGPIDVKLLVAQLVFTITELPTIGGVRVESGGTVLSLPTGDPTGPSATASTLTRDDYGVYGPLSEARDPRLAPPESVTVFFLAGGGLRPVNRSLLLPTELTVVRLSEETGESWRSRIQLERINVILEELTQGPTSGERTSGVVSALEPATPGDPPLVSGRIVVNSIAQGTAVVSLAAEDEFPGGILQSPPALAQLVYTLTALPNIGKVRFLVGLEPRGVVDGRSRPVPASRAVSRDDYANFAAADPGLGLVIGG